MFISETNFGLNESLVSPIFSPILVGLFDSIIPKVNFNTNRSAFSDPFYRELSSDSDIQNRVLNENLETAAPQSPNTVTPETIESAPSINDSQQVDQLTGSISGQAVIGQVSPIFQFSSTRVTITNPSNRTFTLDYIKTPASNIELRSNNTTVANATVPNTNSPVPAAINGGFFVLGTRNLLSIAVNNNVPVNIDGKNDPPPTLPPTRLGANNDRTARGTLYWDGQTNTAGIAVVSNIGQLTSVPGRITNVNNYWAQGGISMALNDATVGSPPELQTTPGVNQGLPQQTYNEDLRGITNRDTGMRERSAMIYDDLSNNGTGATGVDIYLIITQQKVTLGEFRSAIKQTFTTAEDGIFLDGGGSTQMKTPTFSFNQTRIIPQIIALKSV